MPFDYAITTDYVTSEGSPENALRMIARTGWKWLHWCHHWNDDYCYTADDLRQIASWLKELGLQIHDIHGSAGRETAWDSIDEEQRARGVMLVRNRLEMAAAFGCDVVVMHPARNEGDTGGPGRKLESLQRSLAELLPDAERLRVRIAMENMATATTFDQLETLMAQFPEGRVGICYDPGHGNIAGNGLDRLDKIAHRLIALHLNDNNGQQDQHQPLFMGKVDWPRLAEILRRSGYDRPAISVEAVIRHAGTQVEQEFLQRTLASARRFGELL